MPQGAIQLPEAEKELRPRDFVPQGSIGFPSSQVVCGLGKKTDSIIWTNQERGSI